MIFSDRDLRALIDEGRLVIEPFDPDSVQPSSIDLRVGNQFRVFANSRYPYIDVKQRMDELTELVEVSEEEPFILHPGEFVLGSTLERVALPDDVVGRLEGKSSLGRLGLLIHSSLPEGEPVLFRERGGSVRWRPIEEIVRKGLVGEVVSFDPVTFGVQFSEVTGRYEGPEDRIFEIRLASGRSVRVTAGHNLFTLDRNGDLTKIRTGELTGGTFVAIPRHVPVPESGEVTIDLLDLAPEGELCGLILEGPAIDAIFEESGDIAAALLAEVGLHHADYYKKRSRLPADLALQFGFLRRDGLRIATRGSSQFLPVRVEVSADLAWLLGMYVAEGYRRKKQVTWSNTDQEILDRAEQTLAQLELRVWRAQGAITCSSTVLSRLMGWLETGDIATKKRVPPVVFGWPAPLIRDFLEGFVDGDGSDEKTRVSLWTSSEGLVHDFLALLPALGLRASASRRHRDTSVLFQVSIPKNEHKLLTSVPLPDELLVAARQAAGLRQVEASRRAGYRHATDPCNIENRTGRDAIRQATIRRLLDVYDGSGELTEKMARLTGGGIIWDRVVEVRDTGEWETIYDLEVRPGGRKIENFLAGSGGVFVSNTAGYVDPGFDGYLTLELSNVANLPITIYPGMRIGQLSIFRMTSAAEKPYGSGELGSKYLGQEGPTPSRYYENFNRDQ